MSMNLYMECDGESLSLRQTPTQITYTICVDDEGPVSFLKGKKAKRALRAYIEWVRYSSNGCWESSEALEEAINENTRHIEEMSRYLNCKKLKVGVM